jgi:ATP-binding cassette subfamily B protein
MYSMQVLMSLMMLNMIMVTITLSAASARRIVEVLDENSDIVSPENALTTVADGSIQFENVSFKYNKHAEKFALSDINLKIESGQTVGVLGGTGSSKTTLVNLIPHFYDVTDGSIFVHGKDVRRADMQTFLRERIGVVPQKAMLFKGTIRENLLRGKKDATDEELWQALRIAQAEEVVQEKGGLDGVVEQGGKNFSGGQKQRLTIARALVRKPEILILDDSSSALDYATDAELRQAIKQLQTTVVIVSQRASSVRDADKIVVLDDGKAVGIGTHADLMTSCEVYQEIYHSQYEDTQLNNGKGGQTA